MTRIRYDVDQMKTMALFESITRSSLKDMIKKEESILFVVMPGHIGKAIGKQAVNVKKLERVLNKKVRIIEYHPELEDFIKNLIMPLKAADIMIDEKVVTIRSPDTKTRGYLIGRAASTLRANEEIVKRYFDIKEIKIE